MDYESDLVVEFAKDFLKNDNFYKEIKIGSSVIKKMDISNDNALLQFGNRSGVYYDIEIFGKIEDSYKAVEYCINDINFDLSKVMLVGLGNAKYECDALGDLTLDFLKVVKDKLIKFKPLVYDKTGIESVDMIMAIKDIVKPSVIIAIDSLATSEIERIGKCIQVTTAGFIPGSGVGNNRKVLDKEKLKVPTICIGVPFVTSFVANILNKETFEKKNMLGANYDEKNLKKTNKLSLTKSNVQKKYYVSPINIEDIVTVCAESIALGIRRAIENSLA